MVSDNNEEIYKVLGQMGRDILALDLEIQQFIIAYQDGYRGYIPKNTAKVLRELIKHATELRKYIIKLKPEKFQ